MRLEFRQINIRNFLSYGNTPTVVDLSKYPVTIIQADNGRGKTALIFDSIFFALYGSPLRDIKKGGIANFINGKDCVVELEIGVGTSDVTIVRGTRPDKFQVTVNGDEVWTDMKIIDKQKALNDLIAVSKSVVEQIIFIGTKNTPFMQRTTASRRGFVEFILDLQISSRMNDIAKGKIKRLNSTLSDNEFETNRARTMLETHSSLLDSCRVPDQDLIKELEEFIEANAPRLEKGQEKLEQISSSVKDAGMKMNSARMKLTLLTQELEQLESASEKGVCPTCGADHTVDESDLNRIRSSITESQKEVESCVSEYDVLLEKKNALEGKVEAARSTIRDKRDALKVESSYSNDQADDLKVKIKESEEKIAELSTQWEILTTDIAEYSTIQKSLQKGEAKSVIISEYIPFINERVNGYLDRFGIPLLIEFDSEFNESFRSRYRDSASYENFSTGEQAMIDLCMLLTWRDLAEKLTSVSTNLLVIDEYGNNLSDVNVIRMNDVVKSLEGMNFFGMTPKFGFSDHFDHTITIEKEQNFSVIK